MTRQVRLMAMILALAVAGSMAGVLLLTAVLGPSDWGVRCERAPVAQCRIEQTRFFGLFGNSYFFIPESEIRGAETIRPLPGHVGGRGGGSFVVALELASNSQNSLYPVLSRQFQSEADAATDRLNAYFRDKSTPSIEIADDLSTPLLIYGGGPLGLVGALLVLRWWKFRRNPA